jgi:hypothetical protein
MISVNGKARKTVALCLITVQCMNGEVCMEWVRMLTRGRPNVRTVSRLQEVQEVARSGEHISSELATVPSVCRVLCKDILHLRGNRLHL